MNLRIEVRIERVRTLYILRAGNTPIAAPPMNLFQIVALLVNLNKLPHEIGHGLMLECRS